MVRQISLAVLLALTLTAGTAAQSLAGHYKLQGRPNVDIYIVPVPFFDWYIGQVWLDGEPVAGETFNAIPTGPDEYKTENRRGNEGKVTRKDNGDCEAEITSGPNKGKKTTWIRQ